MKLIEIKEVHYEDSAVYYRQKYEATAVFCSDHEPEPIEIPIFFVIEIDPLNNKKVLVELKKSIHYPLIPLLKQLREKILIMQQDGTLF
jgi:hypothetical protein